MVNYLYIKKGFNPKRSMIMSKRIIALIVAAVIVALSLTSCSLFSGKEDNTATQASDTEANQPVVFTMGIDPEYPPFSYLGDDGEYTGFDVEICKAVCEFLGWEFKTFAVNWDEKLVQLDSKECDCVWSGMTILDSMKEAGYVISRPYFDNEQVLLVKDDSEFKSSKDLAGKVVAVQLGTSGESLLQEDLADLAATFGNVITCDSFLKCFTELAGNAVEAVFVDRPVAESYIADHPGYRIIDEDLGAEQYGIAFRAGDEEMCKQIEAGLDAVVASGKYAEIAAKYKDIDAGNLIFLK